MATPPPLLNGHLIAHRGGARIAPENTLPAYREAARCGYRWVECDVAYTADGVPVLFHDDTLERTTNGHGPLHHLHSRDVARLDAGSWFHPRFCGTRVPTLAEALEEWQRLDLHALVELKVGAGQDPERLGNLVARMLVGTPHRLISFTADALAAARQAAPEIPRLLVLDNQSDPDSWLDQARHVAALGLDLEHTLLTRERIAALHHVGLAVLCWTVNDLQRAGDLLSWGIDGVTTDAIDVIKDTTVRCAGTLQVPVVTTVK